jgi:hypothetical protein
MNELATDITDAAVEAPAVEAPTVDVPTVVATVNDLMRWRTAPTTMVGDSFIYFRSSASLMVTRSRSVATAEIADSVMASYLSGRVVPVQRRCGQEWIYSVQATDNGPVQVLPVPQPVRARQ